MKLFSTIFFFSVLINTVAQDIEIYREGYTTDISGTTISGAGDIDEMHCYLGIKNNTTGPLDLTIKRLKIDELSDTKDYMCWGVTFASGVCYDTTEVSPANPYTTTHEYTFPTKVVGILYSYHVPRGNYGMVKYRYYVMNNGIALDSVDVRYNHFLSVKPEKHTKVLIYPNPATDLINVNIENLNSTGTISIYDIAGKVVSEAVIKNGKNQLNIEALNAGVYFYTIRNREGIIETKKLLIQ